jgi:tRNA pseudouridine65 synthase
VLYDQGTLRECAVQLNESVDDRALSLALTHERYVVVAKPSGMAVHRTRGSHGVPLLQRLRDQLGQAVYPAHRLDRGTSGAQIMALDAEAQRLLSLLFERGEVKKSYQAVVRGWPPPTLLIDHPLRRLDDDGVALADGTRQDARSRVVCLATTEIPTAVDRFPTSRYALVRVEPEEGRRHQVRRHLKHVSHPIIGDTTYGKGLHNRFFKEQFGGSRLLLHADWLQFADPLDGVVRTVTVAPPPDFSEPARAAGLVATAGAAA